MKKTFLAVLISLLFALTANAENKKALMLAVFGTSTEASVTFDEFLPMVKKQFPDRTVVVPYLSSIIRNKLNSEIEDPSKKILSAGEMFEKLKNEGYTDIAVVSTLLFDGVEHDRLKKSAADFAAANPKIKVAYIPPFLAVDKNIPPAVGTIKKYIIKNGSNIVVSHGTHKGHAAEAQYLKVADEIEKSYTDTYMGSVEGIPSMDGAMEKVRESDKKNVRFIVFMFVAGDHAENDIAGDDDESFFSAVRKTGKVPDVVYVNTTKGKRFASLGLDKDYLKLLLKYYAENIK